VKRQTEAEPRPNVVLIVADDLGRDIAAYGRDIVPTPAIDRLAGEGVVFERAYVADAVCCPSRSTIYSGLMPHTNGMMGFMDFTSLNDDVRVLPGLLRDAGYWVAGAGKLHVAPRDRFVWDAPFAPLERGDTPGNRKLFRELLDGAKASGRPFFLMLNPLDPHRGGRTEGVPQVVDVDDETMDDTALPYHFRLRKPESVRRYYYRAIARLDETLGAILDELDTSGAARDTLVIFFSDHGEPHPGAKASLYEPGIHVPLIVRWPGRAAAGAREGSLVSAVDIVPTVLDAARAAPPPSLPGRSLLPLLRDPSPQPSEGDAVFASHTYTLAPHYMPARAVVTPRWKYVRNLRPDVEGRPNLVTLGALFRDSPDGRITRLFRRLALKPPEELYDLENDPFEMNDLATDPEHRDVLEALRARLVEHLERTDDPLLFLWEPGVPENDPFEPEETRFGPWEPTWIPDEVRADLETSGDDGG
jgi:N-sulfoglucosamine sulfohydrolase